MTRDTFLARLAHLTTLTSTGWYLSPHNRLRSSCGRCPLTFVTAHDRGIDFEMSEYRSLKSYAID